MQFLSDCSRLCAALVLVAGRPSAPAAAVTRTGVGSEFVFWPSIFFLITNSAHEPSECLSFYLTAETERYFDAEHRHCTAYYAQMDTCPGLVSVYLQPVSMSTHRDSLAGGRFTDTHAWIWHTGLRPHDAFLLITPGVECSFFFFFFNFCHHKQ